MTAETKAELLYCMDFIMHHMSDYETIAGWLTDGCPDGLYQESPLPDAREYVDLETTDEEFDDCLSLFTRILAREVMPGLPDMCGIAAEKGVLS